MATKTILICDACGTRRETLSKEGPPRGVSVDEILESDFFSLTLSLEPGLLGTMNLNACSPKCLGEAATAAARAMLERQNEILASARSQPTLGGASVGGCGVAGCSCGVSVRGCGLAGCACDARPPGGPKSKRPSRLRDASAPAESNPPVNLDDRRARRDDPDPDPDPTPTA